MERDEVRNRLIGILRSAAFAPSQEDAVELDDDTSLLNDTALDSLQLVELIVVIERSFGFRINTKALRLDIFDRFGRVVDLVHGSLGAVHQEVVSDGGSQN